MMRFIVYIGLLLTVAGANEIDLQTPEKAVISYYYAMNHADVGLLEKVMVKDSYDETIQVWALSIGFRDKAFMQVLKQYGENIQAEQEVKEAVANKLHNSDEKVISNLMTTFLGKSRAIIRYKEDGKKKQLYASLHDKNTWKIDYMAGRKVD